MKDSNVSLEKIKVIDLDPEFFVFGNRGAVFSNECHIAEKGFFSSTLCETPMLSGNYAKAEDSGITEIGCEACSANYRAILEQMNEPFAEALYKDEIKETLHWFEDEFYKKELCIIDDKFIMSAKSKEVDVELSYSFRSHESSDAYQSYRYMSASKLRDLMQKKQA